jgi:prepilin-type N-terminal cleavage/methylation domain-containing protein
MGDELEPGATKQRRARSRRDAGFTLTEVIVAVVLMSTAVVPIMLAGLLTVRTSGQTRSLTRIDTVLANAADRVNRAPNSCDYSVYVQAAALAEGWSPSQATVSYKYYSPAANASNPGTWTSGACVNGVHTVGLVQMVTIGITNSDGTVLRTIQVVKSDV